MPGLGEHHPERYLAKLSSNKYKAFNGTFTTTGLLTCWTPATGKKFKLKGWHLVGVVSTILAAANEVTVLFIDDALATATGPGIVAAAAAAAAGTVFESKNTIGDGWLSGAANRVLKIGANADISTGVIMISGMVWGTEE